MATPVQTPEAFVEMHFPKAGIDVSMPFSQQTPRQIAADEYARTSPVAVNVRTFEPGTDRARGGSRGGLVKFIPAPVYAGWIISELNIIVHAGS